MDCFLWAFQSPRFLKIRFDTSHRGGLVVVKPTSNAIFFATICHNFAIKLRHSLQQLMVFSIKSNDLLRVAQKVRCTQQSTKLDISRKYLSKTRVLVFFLCMMQKKNHGYFLVFPCLEIIIKVLFLKYYYFEHILIYSKRVILLTKCIHICRRRQLNLSFIKVVVAERSLRNLF